ncbi:MULTISPECIES: AAA family ATPase [unclassified Campylobacter]|uniref:AAA family ATPase n=1 Tax=unclassified Campylobacter TaxID=2593542 RepID=UPI0022E99AA6|nr:MULTISPECIES: AAA family ATPase [unclassified Campylobacter]MDA3078887.1 ATP-binding protein [Campylobacter sp. CS_NA2]MDA3080822.1 ATP-binding protein [Campylobacter sp. CS_NA1]MDA3084974.1 ATP-binding protein [Campylobacter sp. CS_ED1]MDA3089750.1 ATP-binding protein [Campylobacter sp. CS_ED2]WBR51690.1 AAA family ATPase [Campylobacter sp. CS_NA3]
MRKISVESFRNLGVGDEPAKLYLPDNGLLMVLGENNIGKSNLLDAINVLNTKTLIADDIPNFYNHTKKPKISFQTDLIIKADDASLSHSQLETFNGKLFAIRLTKGSLDKIKKDKNIKDDLEILKILNNEFKNSEIFALYDLDVNSENKRYEIRLILENLNKVYLCSTTRGGNILESFGGFDKEKNQVKNHKNALRLECKFEFVLNNDDFNDKFSDAKELREYLKSQYEEIEEKNSQNQQDKLECSFLLDELDENDKTIVNSNSTDTSEIKNEIGEICEFILKLKSIENTSYDDEYDKKFLKIMQEIDINLKNKNISFVVKNYEKLLELTKECFKNMKKDYKQELPEYRKNFMEKYRTNNWNSSYNYNSALQEVSELIDWYDKNYKKSNLKLENKINEAIKDIQSSLKNHQSGYVQTEYNTLYEFLEQIENSITLPTIFNKFPAFKNLTLPMNFLPTVTYYKEVALSNDDLSVKPSEVEKSEFFKALFKAIDTDFIATKNAYEQFKKEKSSSFYKNVEKRINALIKEKINMRFNELYYQKNDEIYEFELNLESELIALNLSKNGEAISLSKQSVGFKKFFNLFFNFLYRDDRKNGDIVLIDELENSLSIPAKKEIRKFLKEFGEKNNILFIISTQSPNLLDIRHLDEIVIVKKDSNAGATICNDFSILPKDDDVDTLSEIIKALGGGYFSLVDNKDKIVFVEGISDYHYLTCFNKLYEKEKNKETKLVFLPIGGIGKSNLDNECQKSIADKLRQLGENLKERYVTLLLDGDKAGKDFKNLLKNDSIKADTIDEILYNQDKKEIEDLFSDELKEKFNINDKGLKKGLKALKFKCQFDKIEIDDNTKQNFFKLLEYCECIK